MAMADNIKKRDGLIRVRLLCDWHRQDTNSRSTAVLESARVQVTAIANEILRCRCR